MADKVNKNRLGLTIGIFAALLHAVWALIVVAGLAQSYLDWIFPLHFVNSVFDVAAFSLVNAVILIILAFVGGYVVGWILGAIWNWIKK